MKVISALVLTMVVGVSTAYAHCGYPESCFAQPIQVSALLAVHH